jgi:DNA-binding CsgD family transcriptional regulator
VQQDKNKQNAFVTSLYTGIVKIASGEKNLRAKGDSIDLTAREKDIVFHLVLGRSPQEIAKYLSISKETVRKHIANIYTKYDIHSRSELFIKFRH